MTETRVTATAYCDNCGVEVSGTATTEEGKRRLYAWISTRVLCDFCRKQVWIGDAVLTSPRR